MKNALLMILAFVVSVLLAEASHSPRLEAAAEKSDAFQVVEATIAEIHSAMRTGRLTCAELAATYLRRIEAYDQTTALNAIVAINPRALETAEELDEEFRKTGKLR
ncbi:MAG TPA: amidase, partial [Acidobacteriota bacterium]